MTAHLTWFGHSTWLLELDSHKILIDPFLNDNPKAPIEADQAEADFIVVSHGHFDHVQDAVSIAQRTDAVVMANFEVGNWLKAQGVAEDKVIGMNPGGGVSQPFGHLKLTIAHHSSSMPDGSYGGVACGLLFESGGKRLYFACDTALFVDMKLIAAGGLDLAVLPIGDLFTMGPADAVEATRMLAPKRVAPCHYDTWPPIAQDAAAWADQVRRNTGSEPLVPVVGERFAV
ncbi:metal-dependent hydrolase [Posidoniimonas polymericola]|uniref:UPF0173 metal-dependent hydrolase Pla123a_46560 n=1 Tax=Posidoniimonas polymericola TaxID=2528002 RepID=A0A5C5XU65_9BACT|nr:metal-dependent hydrolase [Posidoniimonas polymericola]TWT66767.1 metal-dependent hydrolase [Posidoniimonas polymericola]